MDDPRREVTREDGDRLRVLIVNQHGDNRGDEAAMRAMLAGLDERLGGARFTVVHQFNHPEVSCVDVPQEVEYLPMRLSVVDSLRLAAAGVARRLVPSARRLASPVGRRILASYDTADLVVSAPGGPYFGDLYADHEAVHWFFVWLARGSGAPVALYAPSAGPFENRLLNPLRRRGYGWFDRLVVREERSAAHIRGLREDLEVEVTIDSALQDDPARFAPTSPRGADDRREVVAALRDPGDDRSRHDEAVVEGIAALAGSVDLHVTLLPQVHGRRADAPYLEELARSLVAEGVDATVAPWQTDSDQQRRMIAAADLVIAGRYHPAVFAVSSSVPVLVIPYEHKAVGLAEAAGIDRWIIDLADLSGALMAERLMQLLESSDDVRASLAAASPELRRRSARTSELVASLVAATRDAAA